MAAFSWALGRFRVFLGMGEPPLEIVAYSSGPFFPFRLKQNSLLPEFEVVASQLRDMRAQLDDLLIRWRGVERVGDRPVHFVQGLEHKVLHDPSH